MKIFFSFFLLFCTPLYAQEFGGNPPSLKWKQVNTPQVRIIFPEGLDTQAIQIATIAKKLTVEQPSSLGKALQKVNIVIQNQTLKSNGYVGLGPYRSEFFLSPLPNSFQLGSLPWHQSLAIHEYRHVQQFNNFNKGYVKVFTTLFGQQGEAVASSIVIPNWFWEGDAVANETQVSTQGRGRLPYFFNGYASLLKEHRHYSWLKLRNGSFKDYVPNHYNLGYLMIAYGRQQYGNDFWRKVTQDAVKFKNSFWSGNPFQKAIQRYTGLNYKQYRNNALRYFDSLNVQQRQLSTEMNQLVTESANHKHFKADYQYPYFIGRDSLLVLKNTYHSIPSFYIIDSTGEHRLRAIDLHLEDYYTYHNGKIIYASYKPDLRWGWRDKTRIAIMDIASGKQQYIGRSGRYFSPAMDESGKHIIVVTLNNKGESILNYIDIKTRIIQAIPNTKHLFFTYPKFIDSGNVIAAARLANGKMAIVQVNIKTGNTAYLSPVTNRVIGTPIIADNYIYFTASDQLADQQFALDISTRNLFKVTHDDISSYQPTIKDQKMARVAFTATGYALLQHSIDSSLYEPLDSLVWANNNVKSIYPIITDRKNNINILSDIDTKMPYKVSTYRKGTDFFNFHSWRPFYSTPSYSFTVYGENVINTFRSELSYTYNKNEKSHTIAANALYGALFPYLNIGGNYTFHRTGITDNGQIVHWNEIEANGGFTIPLNLTSGRNYTSLNISSNYTINKRNFAGVFKDSFNNNAFTYLNTTISFTRQIQSAAQHIYPRFAQTFLFNVRNAFTIEKEFQWLASAGLHFPGLSSNHNLVLEGAYQQHDKNGNISFSNGFPFSRGYTVFNFQEMQKLGVNYHFPLLYPDFGIGGLVYFSRVRGNVFYDYTRITHSFIGPPEPLSFNFTSTGAEIYFDTKLWNEYSITIGLRYSRLLDKNPFVDRTPNQWEIVLPTNLF